MKNRIIKHHPLSERCIHVGNGYKAKTLNNIRRRSPSMKLLDESHDIDGINLVDKNISRMVSPYNHHMYIYDRLDIFKNPHQLLIMPKPLMEYIKHAFKD